MKKKTSQRSVQNLKRIKMVKPTHKNNVTPKTLNRMPKNAKSSEENVTRLEQRCVDSGEVSKRTSGRVAEVLEIATYLAESLNVEIEATVVAWLQKEVVRRKTKRQEIDQVKINELLKSSRSLQKSKMNDRIN